MRGRAAARRRAIRNRAGGVACVACGLALGASAGPQLLAAGAARWWPDALRVTRVAVLGQRRLPAAEVAAATGVAPGTRLDRLDRAAILERVEAHPWIAAARIAALPPGRLVVAIREREPVAVTALAAPAEAGSQRPRAALEQLWWVDAGGVPFAEAPPSEAAGLVRVTGVAQAAPGHAHPLLLRGARIAAAAFERDLPPVQEVQLGDADDRELPVLRLAATRARVVLGDGELDEKLVRLGRLLAAGLPEVREASEIDLRFGDRMILRSSLPPDGGEAAPARERARAPERGPGG